MNTASAPPAVRKSPRRSCTSDRAVGGSVMDAEARRLEELAREYQHRVGFFARKVERTYMMGSRWNDDLVSAGYLGLARALRNRRPEATRRELSAYVSQRILGAVIDEARVCLSRHVALESVPGPARTEGEDLDPGGWIAGLVADPSRSPEDAASLRHTRQSVDRALSILGTKERGWIRAYMDGASVRELAESEGVPEGTMRVRFEKATRLLRGRAPHMRRLLREQQA